jgi:hypothetical protein
MRHKAVKVRRSRLHQDNLIIVYYGGWPAKCLSPLDSLRRAGTGAHAMHTAGADSGVVSGSNYQPGRRGPRPDPPSGSPRPCSGDSGRKRHLAALPPARASGRAFLPGLASRTAAVIAHDGEVLPVVWLPGAGLISLERDLARAPFRTLAAWGWVNLWIQRFGPGDHLDHRARITATSVPILRHRIRSDPSRSVR